MAKRRIGCLGIILITLLVIILLMVIAFFIIINLTPQQLGLADKPFFNGKSVRDLGLQDTKIKEIFGFLRSMSSPPKEEDIVSNAPSQEDKDSAEQAMEGSSIQQPDGSIDYGKLAEGIVTFDEKKQLVLKDTELACLFNGVLQSYNDKENVGSEFELLQQLNAKFLEIIISKEGDKLIFTATLSLDISQYVKDINIPFFKLSDTLYIKVTDYITGVDSDGKLTFSAKSVSVNGQSETLSALILDNVLSALSGDSAYSKDDICNAVGSAFSYGIGNLGKVGTFKDNVEKIGIHAVDGDKGQISLITYVANPPYFNLILN